MVSYWIKAASSTFENSYWLKYIYLVFTTSTEGTGKRGHIVSDILLLMMFLGLRKLGNICCGHKM